jgi:hypothetical protein
MIMHGKRETLMTYVAPGFYHELELVARRTMPGVNQWKAPTLRIALEEYLAKRQKVLKPEEKTTAKAAIA